MENVYLAIVLFPLIGAILAGLFGRVIGRTGAHGPAPATRIPPDRWQYAHRIVCGLSK